MDRGTHNIEMHKKLCTWELTQTKTNILTVLLTVLTCASVNYYFQNNYMCKDNRNLEPKQMNQNHIHQWLYPAILQM
jgi:hypothetical protein